MTIVIETMGGGRTEIDCEAEEAARVMQAIYDAGGDGMLRIKMSNGKKGNHYKHAPSYQSIRCVS